MYVMLTGKHPFTKNETNLNELTKEMQDTSWCNNFKASSYSFAL